MNYTLAPKPEQPHVDETITMNGKEIGFVKEYLNAGDEKKFHAGINIDVGDMFPALVQGHADTPDGAIKDALDKGTQYAINLQAGIAALVADLEEK